MVSCVKFVQNYYNARPPKHLFLHTKIFLKEEWEKICEQWLLTGVELIPMRIPLKWFQPQFQEVLTKHKYYFSGARKTSRQKGEEPAFYCLHSKI
jgi:hypothetical protein